MEGGALFNPGFLGGSFLWWVGQIADDSVWRDNQSPGKFEGKNKVAGWGRRYKVRIIGLHDQGEESIPDDQLPWAQVMYPITGGGGQTNAGQTPNLRQGNFVFGFFLDGQDQQVPVIMGVLGNNTQTQLASQLSKVKQVTNASPGSLAMSGYAEGQKDPPKSTAKPAVPDEGKVTQKPAAGKPTIEQVDNPHEQSISDVKTEDKMQEPISLLKPDNIVGSAIQGIQTEIEKVVKKIEKYMKAIQAYIDAASNLLSEIQKAIADAACVIAKYMKIIFDKIMEYVMKLLNKELTKVVASLPASMRPMFSDIKEILIELILCLYNKITGQLCGLIQGLLNQALRPEELDRAARASQADTTLSVPNVPVCVAEDIIGQALSANKNEINQANNAIIQNVNAFLDDVQGQLSGVSGSLPDITSLIGGISGSITAALNFENLKLSVFGCEINPNAALSNVYTFGKGGSASATKDKASTEGVSKAAEKPPIGTPATTTPFVPPVSSTPNQSTRS